jgi:tetratricopeptide (TPR) repeat protein
MAGDQARYQQAMNQGHSAAWDQLWERAAVYYRQALEEYPEQPLALTSLGLALYQLRSFPESLKIYQQAARITPADPMPLEKSAELYELMGDLSKACEEYLRVAETYAKARDLNKAIEIWSHVVRIHPEHILAHSRLALVYERLGKKPQAVTEFIALASLLQKSGEVQKAVQTMTHARQVAPESQEAVRALAMLKAGQPLPRPVRPKVNTGPLVIGQARQIEAPKETQRSGDELDPIAAGIQKAMAELAGLLFEQGDEEPSARRGIHTIISGVERPVAKKIDPGKVFLHLSQAIDSQTQGQEDQALVNLGRAMEAGLDHPAANFDYGALLFKAGRWEEALRALQDTAHHPDYVLATYLMMAQCLEKLERLQESSVTYLEALKYADAAAVLPDQAEELELMYDPIIETIKQQNLEDCTRISKNISELLSRPNWRESLSEARRQLPTQPGGGPPLPLAELLTQTSGNQLIESLNRIQKLARIGLFTAAMEETFYALQSAPTYLPLHMYIAELLLQQNQIPSAVNKLNIIAQSYSSRGQPKRAMEVYRRITDLAPMDMEARKNLIRQLISLDQSADAVGEYLRLADAYYNLADLVAARNTLLEALQFAQKSSVDKEWKLKILRQIADIDLQSLDWRLAIQSLEQVRSIQPDDEETRATLIDLNFRLGQNAQALAELDNYLSFLASSRRRNQAMQFLENLIKENPKQPIFRRRLADLYRLVGNSDEAIAQLDTAAELYLDAGDKNNAMESVLAILAINPPNATEYQQLLLKIKASK